MAIERDKTDKMTVVVPVYNRRHLVVNTLDSILSQQLRPLEIIVVDNNSTDDSHAVVARWIDSHRDEDGVKLTLLSQPIAGAAAARQLGLDSVTTPYVCFFDSDDTMLPGHLQRVMDAFGGDENPDIVFWTPLVNFPDRQRMRHGYIDGDVSQQIIHSPLSTQAYAVKTDFLRRAGGWGGSVRAWDDMELGVRLMLENPKVTRIDNGVSVYIHPDSITGTSFFPKKGEWELALDTITNVIEKKFGAAKKISGVKHTKNHLLGMVDYRRMVLAARYFSEGHPSEAKTLKTETINKLKARLNGRSAFLPATALRLAYHATRMGLRGAHRFAGIFL